MDEKPHEELVGEGDGGFREHTWSAKPTRHIPYGNPGHVNAQGDTFLYFRVSYGGGRQEVWEDKNGHIFYGLYTDV